MAIAKNFFLFLLISTLSFLCGCAGLPDVSAMIDKTSPAQKPRQILSSHGLLSSKQSQSIMERLKRSVDPTDILGRHLAVVESVTESPLTGGNRVTLLADGQATYTAMFKALQNAQNHINLESYIIEDDETGRKFADLLLQKQAQGIQVNLVYDSLGSMNTTASFFDRLADSGIQVVEFNPLNPLKARDHRKILIVDGKVAIIGGINISRVYSSSPFQWKQNDKKTIYWRDTDIQIEGPAVAEFQKLFLDTWAQQKGQELDRGNYFPDLKEVGKALVRVIGSTPGQTNRIPFIVHVSAMGFAEHSIHLTNSYFVPDGQIIKALTEAAERGVDVKLILPGITDSRLALYAQRNYYSKLLKSGVKLYEHRTSLLHAKTAVIDRVWSTVGSTNMDFLSLLSNDEVNAVILNHEFAVEMEKMFVRDLTDSKLIQEKEWEKRPLSQKIRERLAHLLSRWL